MLISPPVPQTQLFQKLTLKIEGQGDLDLRFSRSVFEIAEVKFPSHNVSLTSYRLLSLWFHVNWSSHSWDIYIAFSKFDLENRKVKVIAQGHKVGITPYRLISLSFHDLDLRFSRSVFEIAEVKFPSHNVSLTSYRLLSLWFHVNWSSHSWDIYIAFSKFDLENRKVKVIAQGHKVGITPYRLISLSFHANRPSHSWDTAISKFVIENSRLGS